MDDLEHWNLHDEFTGHQSAAMAVGLEPSRFYDEHDCPTMFSSPAYEAVAAAMRLSYDDASNRLHILATWGDGAWDEWGSDWDSSQLLRSGRMLDFARRIKKGVQVSSEMVDSLNHMPNFHTAVFTRDELARWFLARGNRFATKYEFARANSERQANSSEMPAKPLTTNERNTLLGIIAVMAVKKYGFDPAPTARLELLGRLRFDCEGAGLAVSDDTLRAKLREAFALLPNVKSAGPT